MNGDIYGMFWDVLAGQECRIFLERKSNIRTKSVTSLLYIYLFLALI